MPSVCTTGFQYILNASSSLWQVATSTQVCGNPLEFSTLILEGAVIFFMALGFGFWVMYSKSNK